ncbi:hypothetical protein [Propionivibrio sp.]|uniref:hypothetical protein n=1 Tax=Propionivibrio sp. TaxID=2212460 RepID=UPI003BF03F78
MLKILGIFFVGILCAGVGLTVAWKILELLARFSNKRLARQARRHLHLKRVLTTKSHQ